jgi:glycosyltransferase involved in cell wall biosynthesis
VPQPSVLLVHNYYQKPGGEDEVVRVETAMLRSRGHDVRDFRLHNDAVDHMSKAELAKATLWNTTVHRTLQEELAASGSQVAHFHNTFPLISPAAYYAAQRRGVAVVQTLHNYRLLCPNAVFYRDGGVCEECLGRSVAWPAVVHGCYRGSRVATLAVAGMTAMHRAMGTWTHAVDLYIALTEFGRRKFIEGGIPARKIVVKPNFTEDPGEGDHRGGEIVFAGRLAPEKGIDTLIQAWHRVSARHPDRKLKIVGQGPMATLQATSPPGVEWLGWQSRDQLLQIMQRAALLVFPSVHYEGFPMTLVEAFATGLPVVASNIGAAAEVIRDGRTGRLYRPGDADHLADVLEELFLNEAQIADMGRQARAEYEEKYTPQRNYDQLLAAYALAAEYASDAVAS